MKPKVSRMEFIVSAFVLCVLPVASFAEGGISHGGGNVVNNRTIESYEVDVMQLEGYQEVVIPVLARLRTVRANSLTIPFQVLKAVQNSTWYLLPTSLSALSAAELGLPFESDQIAVQRNGEVFIDKNQFRALSSHEKGTLILHELVLRAAATLASEQAYLYVSADKRVSQETANVMSCVRRSVTLLERTQTDGWQLNYDLAQIWGY